MAIELHFYKSDDTPWGFRLTGGADCDIPLSVVKVFEGTIAENVGLQVEDVIVRIGDQPTAGLTHAEAHEVFLAAGRDFRIAVRRGYAVYDVQDDDQNNEEVSNIMEGSLQESLSTNPKLNQKQKTCQTETGAMLNNPKLNVTDEQIAEAISGEAEVLPDQNVLGVNFNKVDLAESTVLKVIKEETAETNVDLQSKKWSTFLQKPKTPKVIPKKKEPEGPTAPPYRVIITKQKKKSTEPVNQETEISSTLTSEKVSETDIPQLEEFTEECEKDNIDEGQKDEAEIEQEHEQELVDETSDEKKIVDEDISGYSEQTGTSTSPDEKITETATTESSLSLEEQLAQVQQQLQALSQLPSAIQVSLDAVTQQLAKIVGATHRKCEEETTAEPSVTSEDETTQQVTEGETLESMATLEEAAVASDADEETKLGNTELSDISEDEINEEEQLENQSEDDLKIFGVYEENREEHLVEEERGIEEIETEKAIQQERKLIKMEEFHQRRLEQRPTHPLTPLQRPIILPGGRRWSQPDDALPTPRKPKMTDEKICETIETYSEVITGRVKGINFLKYQPPPRNLDYLQHSEVFRLVHDTDPPRKGIAARPGKIASEQDYYTQKPFHGGQQTSVEV